MSTQNMDAQIPKWVWISGIVSMAIFVFLTLIRPSMTPPMATLIAALIGFGPIWIFRRVWGKPVRAVFALTGAFFIAWLFSLAPMNSWMELSIAALAGAVIGLLIEWGATNE